MYVIRHRNNSDGSSINCNTLEKAYEAAKFLLELDKNNNLELLQIYNNKMIFIHMDLKLFCELYEDYKVEELDHVVTLYDLVGEVYTS